MNPDQFFAAYNGKLVNNGGTQCVAVFNQYEHDVVEGGFIGTPLTGYAIDLWTQFGKDSDYANFVRVGADQPAQKGDVAVWVKYPTSALPHVAIVQEDRGGNLWAFGQNPGPAHSELLTKQGLAGYLRPKKFVQAPAPTAPAQAANGSKSGTATVLVDTLHVRSAPSTGSQIVANYTKGQSFHYDSYVVANGYVWLSYVGGSGTRRYVAEGPNDGNPGNVWVSGGVG